MARRRFFVDSVRGRQAVLTGEDAAHLARVLRAEPGRQFEISDNESAYLAEIERASHDEVRFTVLEKLDEPEPGPRLRLAAALVKFDHFEWMIEKATELGVSTILPVIAARSEKGLGQAAAKRLERWRKIARESSQQARRVTMPEVLTAVPFPEAARDPGPAGFFCQEEAGAPPILKAIAGTSLSDMSLLIGPEGGWTDSERALAAECGWRPVSLGPSILRAETAAVAALAILGNAWRAR